MRFALVLAMQPVAEAPNVGSAAFELRWDAPVACPGDADMRAAIERHLAAGLVSPLGDGLRVEGVAREKGGAWEVDLVMESGDGRSERTIGAAPDCAAASETAALVVAIAIDPNVALRGSDAVVPMPTAPTPAEPTPVEPTPVAPLEGTGPTPAATTNTTAPPPTNPLRLRAAFGARADATFGTMPRVGFGGTAFVDLLVGARGRVGVGGSIAGAPPLAVGDASVRMLLWTVELRGCPVFAVRRWLEIVPCVGVQAGESRADPQGLVDGRTQRYPWLAPMAQLATVIVPTPRIGIWLGVHGLVPVFRRAYEVRGEGVVHTMAPFAGGVLVGIEARLP
jgi:hypothetical protein